MNIFGSKKEKTTPEKGTTDMYSGSRKVELTSYTIWWNRGVELCAEACSVCWDKQLPSTYEGLVDYLKRRIATGHTSILEHSNISILINVPNEQLAVLLEAVDSMQYLKHVCHPYKNFDGYALLIGGSYRAYRKFFGTCPTGNPIKNLIAQHVSAVAPKAIFQDMIEMGWIEDTWVSDMSYTSKEMDNCYLLDTNYVEKSGVNSRILLANMTNIESFALTVGDSTLEPIFSMHEIMPMMTATVCFYDLSRAGTHQLVRHRNGITQESQRYVDYSEALFTNPADLKPDKYDKDAKYPIDLTYGDQTAHFDIPLGDLGILVQSIYPQLRHPKDPNLEPLIQEDARAYLPTNIKCRKIYITYTMDYLMQFFILRCAPGAQIEIRNFANTLREAVTDTTDSNIIHYFEDWVMADITGYRLQFNEKFPIPEAQVDEALDTEEKLKQYEKYLQQAGEIGDDKKED